MCNLTTGIYRQEIGTTRIAGKVVVSREYVRACLLLKENINAAEVSVHV